MRSGIIIGGSSGIGEQVAFDVATDERFGDVQWMVPTQEEMDVRSKSNVSWYLREHGPFDFMVYCAGVNTLQWIGEVHQAVVSDTFAVNVEGFIWLLNEHERHFPHRSGSVVAISSDAGRIPMRTSISYCASKAALNMAVKVAARELAPRWQINAVAPGIIDDTKMTEYIDATVPAIRGWTPTEARKYEQSMIPVRRRGFKSEISHVMRDLLCSPGYLTGTIVEISGGK